MTPAAENIRRWRADPVAFVRDNFGVEPQQWQADALRAFADPDIPRISMQACAGPGKSALLAWCGWHFLATQGDFTRTPVEVPMGYVTSVTGDTLQSTLWREFAKWQDASPWLTEAFEWSSTVIKRRGELGARWRLEPKTWPKDASPDAQGRTLSGLHGGYLLFLIDESGTIPTSVGKAAEQALSETGVVVGKILQAGNPISRDGMLYEAGARRASQWHVIRITGDPDDSKRSPRINIDWAREQIATYGRDDPWVQAYILGQFPAAGINALLSEEEVLAAMDKHYRPHQFQHSARILGVDVAREGDDRSVIFARCGLVAADPIVRRGLDSLEGGGMVARLWKEGRIDAVFIDDTGGFGAGWIDRLRELGHAPVGIHFASKATTQRYANKRTEMWMEMAKWVKAGGALPKVPELVAELTTPTYGFRGDALLLEPKERIKERLGRSPDLADALALTFAAPVVKQTPEESWLAATAPRMDYDPYDDQPRRRVRPEHFDPFAV